MPILAPVADLCRGAAQYGCHCLYHGQWVDNLITPTFALVIGGLAIGRVPYQRWLRYVWPLLLVLTAIVKCALILATLI